MIGIFPARPPSTLFCVLIVGFRLPAQPRGQIGEFHKIVHMAQKSERGVIRPQKCAEMCSVFFFDGGSRKWPLAATPIVRLRVRY